MCPLCVHFTHSTDHPTPHYSVQQYHRESACIVLYKRSRHIYTSVKRLTCGFIPTAKIYRVRALERQIRSIVMGPFVICQINYHLTVGGRGLVECTTPPKLVFGKVSMCWRACPCYMYRFVPYTLSTLPHMYRYAISVFGYIYIYTP